MKRSTITLATVAAASFASSISSAEETKESDAFLGLTPSLHITTRYEFREQDGFDPSHSLTARARVGLMTGEYNGFSAFGELETTYALIDDYRSANASTSPFVAGNTQIADPENQEVNRAWVQYKNAGFTMKAGRQRIKKNKDAFIGNVGWRQNEQTYDAITLGYKGNGMDLSYSYANRVQRIFGDDAAGALKEFDGEFHFLDASYEVNGGKIGGYVYLIDVDNNAAVGESNTFGLFYDGNGLLAELAWQDGESTLVTGNDYDAVYGHLKYAKKVGGATYGIGLEYLEEDFKTPLATVHAFNGFADAFIGQRIGLNKNMGYEGIADIYLSYVRPNLPGGITFKGFLHYMMDDGFGDTYGYEADAVFVKKISENTTALLKAAYFMEDDGPGNFEDIKQVTLDFTYKF